MKCQILLGDNLHELSNPIFQQKEAKYFIMLSVEFLPSMLSIKPLYKQKLCLANCTR